jgi:hypothetical protein
VCCHSIIVPEENYAEKKIIAHPALFRSPSAALSLFFFFRFVGAHGTLIGAASPAFAFFLVGAHGTFIRAASAALAGLVAGQGNPAREKPRNTDTRKKLFKLLGIHKTSLSRMILGVRISVKRRAGRRAGAGNAR